MVFCKNTRCNKKYCKTKCKYENRGWRYFLRLKIRDMYRWKLRYAYLQVQKNTIRDSMIIIPKKIVLTTSFKLKRLEVRTLWIRNCLKFLTRLLCCDVISRAAELTWASTPMWVRCFNIPVTQILIEICVKLLYYDHAVSLQITCYENKTAWYEGFATLLFFWSFQIAHHDRQHLFKNSDLFS